MGDITNTDTANPREGFADGDAFADELQGQLLDPWGKQYYIVLAANSDQFLKLDAFFQDLKEPIRNSAAVFSMAKNNEIGAQGYQGRSRKERSNEPPDDLVEPRPILTAQRVPQPESWEPSPECRILLQSRRILSATSFEPG